MFSTSKGLMNIIGHSVDWLEICRNFKLCFIRNNLSSIQTQTNGHTSTYKSTWCRMTRNSATMTLNMGSRREPPANVLQLILCFKTLGPACTNVVTWHRNVGEPEKSSTRTSAGFCLNNLKTGWETLVRQEKIRILTALYISTWLSARKQLVQASKQFNNQQSPSQPKPP